MNLKSKWVRIIAWVLVGAMVITSAGIMIFF